MDDKFLDRIIAEALKEDMPAGDLTSESIVSRGSFSRASIVARQAGILAGIDVAKRVFEKIDREVSFTSFLRDGEKFRKNERLALIEGKSLALLQGERTALNFLQRMSGIATLTHRYVKAVEMTKAKILDTRKTTPCLRALEKYAVRMGGGMNHRMNLSEMVLIKDNHRRLAGTISEAVSRVRERFPVGVKIEVEASSLEEVKEALVCGVDMIMLDNMSLEEMKAAVEFVSGRIPVEASGRMNLKRIKEVANLGVDFISVGALTHSSPAIDISMEFLE